MSSFNTFTVAVCTYNAFTHLGVLYDIMRRNWSNVQVPIYLISNHPQVADATRDLKFERIVAADASIPWTHDGGKTTDKIGFRARALDCVQHAGTASQESGSRYTVITHADGWLLSYEKVQYIVDFMAAHHKVVGAGGWGLDHEIKRYQIEVKGDLDDYFFIIDNDFARSTGFWNFKARYADPVLGHVFYLVTRFREKATPEQLYLYRDYREEGVEYGGNNPRDVKPWRYDTLWEMLHIDDFVTHKDVAEQAFARNNIRVGSFVEQLLTGTLSWQAAPPVVHHLPWQQRLIERARMLWQKVPL